MGYIAKLTRGALTLDLNDNEYSLASGFTPPAIMETANIAYGTSANRYGGGKKIDERVLPREYSFTVKVSGTSNAQCEQAIDRLDTFLRKGTDSDPVYFCFKPDSNVSHEPLWGQFGATRRCKVLAGHAEKSGEIYGEARGRVIFADVSLTINGVEGLRQRVGEATGGIIENTMFSPDGISRGLMIPEATTNIFDNPVFGNADPDNQYTTGAGLISATNTDKEFVYPGATNSIKITRIGAADVVFTQSIAAGETTTYTISAWVKKADGTAATAADCGIYYNDTVQTSTYAYLGNGITRVSWTGAAIVAASATGVWLGAVGVTIYLLGLQMEEKAYATPLCWGDLMGCSWGGTAHADASTSTRTAARWQYTASELLNIAEGTVVITWMPDKANTAFTADVAIWKDSSNDSFATRFDSGDEKFYFSDGINEISSAATTFAANTPIVLHYVYEVGSLKIYRAGVEIATGSTYTPPTLGDHIYLGSSVAASQCGGTFLGFHTYNYAMSATEVSNDYTNIWAHVSGGDGYGQRLEGIPWIFDNAGDLTIDNYCDATHWDWIICGGIPGSLPAETIFITANSADSRSLTIANHQSSVFHSPTDYFSAADATVAGLNTTATLGKAINVAAKTQKDLCQYPAYLWASLHDHGANLMIAPRVETSTNSVGYTGDYRPITTSTTNKDFLTYSIENIKNPETSVHFMNTVYSDSIDYELWLDRSADGAADVTIDYMRVMFGSLTYIYNDEAADSDLIVLNPKDVYLADGTTVKVTKITSVIGDLFELYPDTLNHMVLQTGDLGADTVTTATTLIWSITITPRWALA